MLVLRFGLHSGLENVPVLLETVRASRYQYAVIRVLGLHSAGVEEDTTTHQLGTTTCTAVAAALGRGKPPHRLVE
jgi:hypothetical protein